MADVDTNAVRDYVVESHSGTVKAVRACATAAVRTDSGAADRPPGTTAVRRTIEACLRQTGIWDTLPRVLVGSVERTGRALAADPVAAPPYVAATATGVVLRATLGTGRLVVAVDPLTIHREEGRTGGKPRPRDPDTPLADLVRVEWRP